MLRGRDNPGRGLKNEGCVCRSNLVRQPPAEPAPIAVDGQEICTLPGVACNWSVASAAA